MDVGYGSVPEGGAKIYPSRILEWAFTAHTRAMCIIEQYDDFPSESSEKEKEYVIDFLTQAIFLYKKAGITQDDYRAPAFYKNQMLLAQAQLNYVLGKEPDSDALISASELEQKLGDVGGKLEQRLGDRCGF